MLKFNIITLFPEIIEKHLEFLPFKKAIEKNLITVNIINLRNYAIDARGSVDDKPYGGGTGMLLRIEPLYDAITENNLNTNVILLTPTGTTYTQNKAKAMSEQKEISLICGRYEGVDARIDKFINEKVSVGNYILSGGELAALIVMESTTRLLKGVLEKEDATTIESFENDELEFPQYTRPEDFKGLKVPDVLLSGNHKEIENWKKNNSKKL